MVVLFVSSRRLPLANAHFPDSRWQPASQGSDCARPCSRFVVTTRHGICFGGSYPERCRKSCGGRARDLGSRHSVCRVRQDSKARRRRALTRDPSARIPGDTPNRHWSLRHSAKWIRRPAFARPYLPLRRDSSARLSPHISSSKEFNRSIERLNPLALAQETGISAFGLRAIQRPELAPVLGAGEIRG